MASWSVRRVLTAGGAYGLAYVLVTGFLPAPASTGLRHLLADLYLFVPTAFALAATVGASRRSLGPERAFWSLLAGACAAQVIDAVAFALHETLLPLDAVQALASAGYYTFYVLVAVSVAVWPHRSLPRARVAGATLECLMVAAAGYFLLFYFIGVGDGEGGLQWVWIFTAQQAALAAGFIALALVVRDPPYALVYRVLACGLGLAAVLEVVPSWLYAVGRHDLYSPASVNWIVVFVTIAAAAAAPRGVSWARAADEAEPPRARVGLAAGAVALPALVDLVSRALGLAPHLEDARSALALGATGVLFVLAALRLRTAHPALPAASGGGADLSSEYLHFATGVAHELNNPLMAVAGWAELAVGRGEPRAPLEALLAATRKAAAIVFRLQQFGDAAGTTPGAPPEDSQESAPVVVPRAVRGIGWGRLLIGATIGFLLVYFAVRRVESSPVPGDVLYVLPPLAAAALLSSRGRLTRSPRRAAFWRLLALGATLWALGDVLWIALEASGATPDRTRFAALDVLFLGFLVPMIVALALRPHGRDRPMDATAWTDLAVVWSSILYVFARFRLLPAVILSAPTASTRVLLGVLTAVLAGWAAFLWCRAPSAGWRRAYGQVTVFAALYGTLSAVANGISRPMPPPGGPADLAWILPFAFLAAAALPGHAEALGETPAALLFGPAAAIGLDLAVTCFLPDLAPPRTPGLAVLLAALVAVAIAWRLHLDAGVERRARREARLKADELQRTGRLRALASVTAVSVADLLEAVEEVCQRARAAAVILPERGDQMLQQARRAREIVRDLSSSLRLGSAGAPLAVIHVGRVVEDVVQAALDEGLPLQVSLEGLGALPPIDGDPHDLAAAVGHLVKNAAQASPGGVLRIAGAVEDQEVVVRFLDDGPGVPPTLRAQVFDPFFTTRPIGQGVGLGLTLVHFAARAHGGSIVLEDSPRGASFALRFPARERRTDAIREARPLALAALVAATVAVVLAVLPDGEARTRTSVVLQIGSALLAMGAFAWAAARQTGRGRRFWGLMAMGPAIWALTRMLGVAEGGFAGAPSGGLWHLVLYALADLSWAAALLLRADRGERPRTRLGVGVGAALLLFGYAQAHLVVLPDPFALTDPALREQLVLVRALQKLALPGWAAVLAAVAHTSCWRGLYRRLAVALGVWAVGQSVAFHCLSQPGYQAGSLSDLGWIVPFLWMAALALGEARRKPSSDTVVTLGASVRTAGLATWLFALAAIVAFESVFGARSGYPSLDAARGALLRAMVVVMAVMLAAHEILARQKRGDAGRPSGRDAFSSRWVGLVASAVHELGGQLSGIAAVNRLILAQSDLHSRTRADVLRAQEHTDGATRVVKNLLAALPSSSPRREPVSIRRVIEEAVDARRRALSEDGIEMAWGGGADVADFFTDADALRQVIVGLLDRAALSIRSRGGPGRIDVAAEARPDAVVVTVGDTGQSPPSGVLTRLVNALIDLPGSDIESELSRGLVRDTVARLNGSLRVQARPGGGAEVAIRLPRPMADRPAVARVAPAGHRGSAQR